MTAEETFGTQWRDRLSSGSKLAAKALSQALKDDASRLPEIAPLLIDTHPTVRVSALRALADVSRAHPAPVARYAREVVEALAAPESDAQSAALDTLANIAPHAAAECALALPLISELLGSKRPGVREEAARCLGRLGVEVPSRAPEAARRLADALALVKSPRQAHEAREILAALEGVIPNLGAPERAALAPRIHGLRAHPNLQVRERAGRLARLLA